MELVGPLIVFISFPAILAWAIYYSKQKRKKVSVGMRNMSQELSLEWFPGENKFFKSTYDHLAGTYRGTAMRVYPKEIKRGKHTQYYTDFIIQCHNPRKMKLLLESEGIINMIGDLLGIGDTKIGDSKFDNLFRIKAEKTNHLTALFTRENMNSIYALWETNTSGSKITIDGNQIIYTEEALPGISKIEDRAKIIADTLLNLSKRMEVIDWGDDTGSSWWDENREENQGIIE